LDPRWPREHLQLVIAKWLRFAPWLEDLQRGQVVPRERGRTGRTAKGSADGLARGSIVKA
jgi:hypothetical protein